MPCGIFSQILAAWLLHALFGHWIKLDAEAFQSTTLSFGHMGRFRGAPTRTTLILHASVAKNGMERIGYDNDRPKTPRKTEKDASKQRNYSLNSDLHFLKKKRNGTLLAEQRLETAIHDMLETKRRSKYEFSMDQQFPDVVSFNTVISAHAKNAFRDRKAAGRAERLLRRMDELAGDFAHLTPTIFTLNSVMEAYSKNPNTEERTVEVMRLNLDLEGRGLSPNTYTLNLLLASICTNSKVWASLEKWALDFLRSEPAVEYNKVDTTETIEPDRQTYNTLFNVYGKIGAFKKAEYLMQQILELDHHRTSENGHTLQPSRVWYHCVFKALATTNELGEDEKERESKRLLKDMQNLSENDFGDALAPDTETYNHILNVFALMGGIDAAVLLLENMESGTQSRSNIPDCISYTTVLKTFATAQQKLSEDASDKAILLDLAEKATSIFYRMPSDAPPNAFTYNTMIKIWVNVDTRDSLQKAESLLREMKNPDSISYSTLIHGWSKLRFPGAGSRAKELFDELLQLPPSLQRRDFNITTVCNSVMSSFARSGDRYSPKVVESLLAQLEGRFLNGDRNAQLDKTSFLCVFDAYAKAGVAHAEERCEKLLNRMQLYKENFNLADLEPDRVVYNAYLNALAKSQQQSAVEKAEEILTMMETSRNPDLRPDIVTYSTFIDCHTKCGERSLERADELLRFVEGTYRRGDATLKPNAVFYSAILQAWAKTGTAKGAMKAEELLQRNIALFEEGNDYAKPHIIVYNAVMDALARGGVENAGSRAEELLEEAGSLYDAGDEEMRPTRRSYNAVILAHRSEGDAGAKAEKLLDRMEELADSGRNEVRPDVVTYNNVISAVIQDSGMTDSAADKAQFLLDRMEQRGHAPTEKKE
ncbi:PPR: pentatricopeptide repeat domain containing protein [Nitzschia inconspicua]|uniref:PPR: pentatricopeptide repeat domain containing protein n=1 Tax=Nitzschia inconspicua TaxID=303405 RepID=A0A9K3PPK1_9STRA|nr:PPR: pentatricopeptide repeat domain containing protein [Nitzschia inconspicua]